MNRSKAKLVVLLALSLLVGCTFILKLIGNLGQRKLNAREVGSPIVSTQDCGFISSSITQILTDEANIYLVYGYRSIVQVYSLDGTYQYTLAVYNHNNGRTEIGVNDDILYIRDKINNIYLFSEEKCIGFWNRSDLQGLPGDLYFGINTPNYSVKGGSIWYGSDDTDSYCVIHRSGLLALYQDNVIDLLLLFLVIMIGIVLRFPFLPKRE